MTTLPRLCVSVLVLLVLSRQNAAAQSSERMTVVLDSLRTSPAPASGFTAVTIPGAPGTTTMVLRIDDGRWIPPHVHNVAKLLRVVEGTLLVGHGDHIATTGLRRVAAGDSTSMDANHAHFEGSVGRTLVVLTAASTLTTTWVRSTDGRDGPAARPRRER